MTVIYSINPSLDGYIAGPGGDLGWSAPSDELHRFHNEQVRALGAHLLGRKLYETMVYWETPEPLASGSEIAAEFAQLWRALPKVVFSTTLTEVQGEHARLARGTLAEELEALRGETDRDIAVGGGELAAAATQLGLVDEYRIVVRPALLGAGTPCFGASGGPRVPLELVETRTIGDHDVYLRYRRAR